MKKSWQLMMRQTIIYRKQKKFYYPLKKFRKLVKNYKKMQHKTLKSVMNLFTTFFGLKKKQIKKQNSDNKHQFMKRKPRFNKYFFYKWRIFRKMS